MDARPTPDDPLVAAAFLELCLKDRAGAGLRTLAEYQALWPEHADQIAREYAALRAPADGEPDPSDASTVGPYRLVSELGRGGQGVVYVAEDPRLRRRVALKVIEGLGPRSEELLARFRREAEVASRLDHPAICGVLASGVEGSRAWIAMRLVDGDTLADGIRAAGRPPRTREEIDACLALFEKLARALHVAHEAGIVHRDIKPGNVMVTPQGEPVLLDFGLARDEEGEHDLTRTGDVFGTPAYMSPEQLSGRGPRVDRRTDVYSLGVTLYERLALAPPFHAPTRDALYHAVLNEEAPDVRRRNAALTKDLSVVVATALAKDRDHRYQTTADLAEDLRRLQAREPILARPAGPVLRFVRWVQRNAAVSALAAGLFAALFGGLLLTAGLLNESEGIRAELAEANLKLQAQLEDVLAGRESRLQRRVQDLVDAGWHDAVGATTGEAARHFTEALALDAQCKQALVGLAWCGGADGRDGLAALDEHGAAFGDDPDLRWLRGFLLDQAGRDAEAREAYAAAGERESGVRLYLAGLRTVDNFMSFDREKARAAHALFERAVARASSPRFHYFHAVLMSAAYAGEREWMEAAAQDLIHHWPDAPNTWDAVAQFFFSIDAERAEQAMLKSFDLRPGAAACCGLAGAALGRGERERAREWFDKGIEVEPSFAPVWAMRGDLLFQEQEHEAARQDYLTAVAKDPTHPHAYAGLDKVHAALGDAQLARADWRRLADEHPRDATAVQRLARLAAAEGDHAAACEHWREAARRRPHDPAVLRKWREALQALGAPDRALEALSDFADEHPDSRAAALELRRLRERLR